eukprot:499719-Pyramimonas_sp.AAC.3
MEGLRLVRRRGALQVRRLFGRGGCARRGRLLRHGPAGCLWAPVLWRLQQRAHRDPDRHPARRRPRLHIVRTPPRLESGNLKHRCRW